MFDEMFQWNDTKFAKHFLNIKKACSDFFLFHDCNIFLARTFHIKHRYKLSEEWIDKSIILYSTSTTLPNLIVGVCVVPK